MKVFLGYNNKPPITTTTTILVYYYIYMVIITISYMQIYVYSLNLPPHVKIPALLVFGDSIVDPGNNNYIPTIGRVNHPPYGRDFKGGVPTGRFSNGKIPSDFIAEEIGIKELVPAYLDPTLEISDLVTGVSFASGASGYDPLSSKPWNVLTLEDQVNLFREYIKKLRKEVGEKETQVIISESIYILCQGSNDISNTYFGSPFRKLHYDISSYTDLMLQWASTFLQELYSLGARRIGVVSIPPIGCVPSQRTLSGGLLRQCAQNENQASILFNNKLYNELNILNNKLNDSRFVYLDIYTTSVDVITNPSKYGFEVIDRGCCGTGKIEVAFLCTELDVGTCTDASKYVFWDSYHPTEAAYRLMVQDILQKKINDFF